MKIKYTPKSYNTMYQFDGSSHSKNFPQYHLYGTHTFFRKNWKRWSMRNIAVVCREHGDVLYHQGIPVLNRRNYGPPTLYNGKYWGYLYLRKEWKRDKNINWNLGARKFEFLTRMKT